MITKADFMRRAMRYEIQLNPRRVQRPRDGAVGWIAAFEVWDYRGAAPDTLLLCKDASDVLFATEAEAANLAQRAVIQRMWAAGDPMAR